MRNTNVHVSSGALNRVSLALGEYEDGALLSIRATSCGNGQEAPSFDFTIFDTSEGDLEAMAKAIRRYLFLVRKQRRQKAV